MQHILDQNGQIKKNDFIDYCMEVKLLDLTDKNKDRKHDKEEEMDMKKEKQKEVMTKWNNNLNFLISFR